VASAEPFVYFVQVGAFRTQEDADAQRAKLSMSGFETRITEREQAGRTVYRVRAGPFERREDAERVKSRLSDNGIDNQLVSVQR
jgi:cell division protein FtsN